ncbi:MULTISPECIES: hypothetical protein [Pandoraea]|jgi:hypothetical protein|uniref:ACT domain-containing protein n=1 Tax=Pandoraea pnomenusa TaxID=93220 RepID=A0A378YXM1_9BURK|nr:MULTISPECIES: hypothetical protein [Pandoraea]AHB77151.1 hypothetical protein X636_18105 [Pandoraea pnomenusa]ALR36017.1 hypothetical protein LV28_22415 [Pandoraea pnomenusa]MBN9095556.1 hypothetical protein [Pandoraea pnomenusa]QDH59099.1 hypothetical protein FKQ53_07290 [Pandoraea pnomenusa]SUA81553.1 Uncharacterised protein [Pandoraea pnomenusa]
MRAIQTFQAFQGQPTRATPVSHLTVVCLADALGALRKQMFVDLTALGLRATHVSITHWNDRDEASATVTLDCPKASRASLTSLVMRLSDERCVRRVFWSDDVVRRMPTAGASARA